MKEYNIRRLIVNIMDKAVEKSFNTESDVFINYYSNSKNLTGYIYINGFKEGVEADHRFSIYINEALVKDYEAAEEKLQKAYDLIYSL